MPLLSAASTQVSGSPLNAARASEPGRLLTADELAERWQVPTAQVYRLARDGRLPAVSIGRYRRFALAAVESWEQSGGAAANE
jgi:excisionase family DNA binding protein